MPSNKPTVSMESVAKLTSKNHTTLPIAVRKALDVGPHDWISSAVLEGGKVEATKTEDLDSGPVVRRHLAFLEEEMIAHPENLSVIERDDTMRNLLKGIKTEGHDFSG